MVGWILGFCCFAGLVLIGVVIFGVSACCFLWLWCRLFILCSCGNSFVLLIRLVPLVGLVCLFLWVDCGISFCGLHGIQLFAAYLWFVGGFVGCADLLWVEFFLFVVEGWLLVL